MMVKVETLRRHGNSYPPTYWKNKGRRYEVAEGEEGPLIASGLVRLAPAKAATAPAPPKDE